MTGRKIYENFINGVGPEGLSSSAAMVNALAAEYQAEGDAVRRLTAKMESVWQGDAAGAAQRGAGPLATEHELAEPHMATAQDLDGRQAESFAEARNAVVPVPPEPTAPDPWAVFASPGPVVAYRQQVADYNAANQHNVDVMSGYTSASSYNTTNMPRSYGSLTNDQAGIVVDSGTSDTASGPRRSGAPSDGGPPDGERRIVEGPTRGYGGSAPPDTGGASPNPGGTPSDTGGSPGPQQTTPGGFTPTPVGPPPPVPVGTGGGLGSGPTPGASGGGLAPGTGFVPFSGGPDDKSGGRGPSSGSGGRGIGGLGSGSDVRGPGGRAAGDEPHGPGGRAGVGEPHGSGGRPGVGPAPGWATGEPHAAGRGGAAGGAGRGGMGAMPLAGARGRGDDDLERRSPAYLQEDDPEAVFGTDVLTAPPVIGEEDLEPPKSDEQPTTV